MWLLSSVSVLMLNAHVPCLCCSPGQYESSQARQGEARSLRLEGSRPSIIFNPGRHVVILLVFPRRVLLYANLRYLGTRYSRSDRYCTYFPHAGLTDAMAHHFCRHFRSSRPSFSRGKTCTHHLASTPCRAPGSNQAANRKSPVDPPHPSFSLERSEGKTDSALSTSKNKRPLEG